MKITFRGVSHDITTYAALSDEEVRAVVHGYPAGTTPRDLVDGLRIRTQNTRFIQGKMLGKSKTALITFESNKVPEVVYYYGDLHSVVVVVLPLPAHQTSVPRVHEARAPL
ncbi:hypothetical protein HPB48_019214 [Haemaphysalis longicornis]|uniref:Uncharacterized protein n=1 Tax=Haemaphysalis longicornis TaxID=44386 RepID=A0A9J6GA26_HAELO|nr:hypothetical protein HPB48_019214 [Haemaphysalis longicornis]